MKQMELKKKFSKEELIDSVLQCNDEIYNNLKNKINFKNLEKSKIELLKLIKDNLDNSNTFDIDKQYDFINSFLQIKNEKIQEIIAKNQNVTNLNLVVKETIENILGIE